MLDYTVARIDGRQENLAEAYGGKVALIVNVASRCGNTPQYAALQAIYERYQPRGFEILGFPANDFGGQEPGANAEIAEFCDSRFGVTFPMFEKIAVTGDEKHPLYQQLTSLPEPIGGDVQWNFQKFLVDRDGEVVARFSPRTPPDAPEVTEAIEKLLG